MSDVSALTLPLPSACLGVLVLAWISAGPGGAASRAQGFTRTTPAFQKFNQRRFWTTTLKIYMYFDDTRFSPVVPAVESHVQPETDCCTVCSVANLVTSHTTLETHSLLHDGGLRTITVTSVSGPSCSSWFSSCWASTTVTSNDVACISNRFAGILSGVFPPLSKHGGIHPNQIASDHHVMRCAFARHF